MDTRHKRMVDFLVSSGLYACYADIRLDLCKLYRDEPELEALPKLYKSKRDKAHAEAMDARSDFAEKNPEFYKQLAAIQGV